MTMRELGSRWFEYDELKNEFVFTRTEDYVFGKFEENPGKRVGDMTREELIQALSTAMEDRDNLAKLIVIGDATENYSYARGLAKRIVKRIEEDGDG